MLLSIKSASLEIRIMLELFEFLFTSKCKWGLFFITLWIILMSNIDLLLKLFESVFVDICVFIQKSDYLIEQECIDTQDFIRMFRKYIYTLRNRLWISVASKDARDFICKYADPYLKTTAQTRRCHLLYRYTSTSKVMHI